MHVAFEVYNYFVFNMCIPVAIVIYVDQVYQLTHTMCKQDTRYLHENKMKTYQFGMAALNISLNKYLAD